MVWTGRRRGIYSSWLDCERQVKGFVGARYKSFRTVEEAKNAFGTTYSDHRAAAASVGRWAGARTRPIVPSLSVDAACSGSPGRLEYQGVNTATGQRLFHAGPFADGTNNVGEFLAIADALRWLVNQDLAWPTYSDSETAIGWVLRGKCNTKLARTQRNAKLFERIKAAEGELHHIFANGRAAGKWPRVLKWDTGKWGEIPADFGRK